MATRILGIDLGTYAVKVLVAAPGFRHITPLELIERPLPPPATEGESHWERAARALAELVREHRLDADAVYTAAGGDQLFIHVLEFAFRNLRRPDLEKAVGAELEGILPVDLEDMVYGFESLPADLGDAPAAGSDAAPADLDRPVGDDEPTAVRAGMPGAPGPLAHGPAAPPAEGMRVLACAMEIARARHLIELLDGQGLEPRAVLAAPAVYAAAAERIEAAAMEGEPAFAGPAGPLALIDIGHTRTQVCVVASGRPVYARSISRGGRQVTEAIQRGLGLPLEDAERAKHTSGFVASAAEPATTAEQQRMHGAVSRELAALARELRRTLQSCRAKAGAAAARAVLVGGGSRLGGAASFLAESLGIPVTRLRAEHARSLLGDQLTSAGAPADTACVAAGAAIDGAGGRPHFDLRQGELSYKVDLSFLRQKTPALVTALVVLLAFATFNGYAALFKLRRAEASLQTRLSLETAALFGEPLDTATTMERIRGKTGGKESVLPRMTAYDVLLELNGKLPARDKVTLDVEDLDIRPGKISFKATAKNSPEIDAIEEALDQVECFEDISRGSTSVGAGDVREFSFTITTNCM